MVAWYHVECTTDCEYPSTLFRGVVVDEEEVGRGKVEGASIFKEKGKTRTVPRHGGKAALVPHTVQLS